MKDQEKLRMIYKYKPKIEYASLWINLCSILKEEGLLSKKYEIIDKLRTVDQIEVLLSKGESFIIEDEIFSFSCSSPFAGKLQQLIITKKTNMQRHWDKWVKKLSEGNIFVYAWRYDTEYIFWQNDTQIDTYQLMGKPYGHLPTRASGMPLPCAQIEIDTSRNPGRNVFKTGYVEAVGSTMWLGEDFFALTGANKEAIEASGWLKTSELKPGILKIQAQEACFTQSEGIEAELQNKMRDLLYPEHD